LGRFGVVLGRIGLYLVGGRLFLLVFQLGGVLSLLVGIVALPLSLVCALLPLCSTLRISYVVDLILEGWGFVVVGWCSLYLLYSHCPIPPCTASHLVYLRVSFDGAMVLGREVSLAHRGRCSCHGHRLHCYCCHPIFQFLQIKRWCFQLYCFCFRVLLLFQFLL
jgi:hypothetical protein